MKKNSYIAPIDSLRQPACESIRISEAEAHEISNTINLDGMLGKSILE